MLLNYSVGEDSWESLGLQGVQTNPKGNQSWIFIGRTDAEVEAQCFGHLMWRAGGKYWSQENKRMTEDEMVGWHHRLNGHEFEQALGVGDGHGAVHGVPKSWKSWTQLSNWTELKAGKADRRMRFLQGLQKALTYFWEYVRSCACIRMWACSENTQEGPELSLLLAGSETLCKQDVKARAELSAAWLGAKKCDWSPVRTKAI